MKTARVPWHHKDSDYVPDFGRISSKKSYLKVLRNVMDTPLTSNGLPLRPKARRTDLKDDVFMFGYRPFEQS